MFLLNSNMILLYRERGLLEIRDFDKDNLHPTHYYFRLGRYITVWDEQRAEYRTEELGEPGKETLVMPPRGYALIQSLEYFACSERVLGVFGQISALPRMGLRLNHGPTIDPKFAGHLEMGLESLLPRPREIEFRQSIAKVVFYDISDTYPIGNIAGTLSEKDYQRRRELRGAEPL